MSKKPRRDHGVQIEFLEPQFEIKLGRSIQVIRVISDPYGRVDVMFMFSSGRRFAWPLYPTGRNAHVGILAANFAYYQMKLVLEDKLQHGKYDYTVEQYIAAIKDAAARARRKAKRASAKRRQHLRIEG